MLSGSCVPAVALASTRVLYRCLIAFPAAGGQWQGSQARAGRMGKELGLDLGLWQATCVFLLCRH